MTGEITQVEKEIGSYVQYPISCIENQEPGLDDVKVEIEDDKTVERLYTTLLQCRDQAEMMLRFRLNNLEKLKDPDVIRFYEKMKFKKLIP